MCKKRIHTGCRFVCRANICYHFMMQSFQQAPAGQLIGIINGFHFYYYNFQASSTYRHVNGKKMDFQRINFMLYTAAIELCADYGPGS